MCLTAPQPTGGLQMIPFRQTATRGVFKHNLGICLFENQRESSLCLFTATATLARPGQSIKLHPGLPREWQGPKNLNHPQHISQAVSRELAQKWSSWDIHLCQYGILALQAMVSPIVPQYGRQNESSLLILIFNYFCFSVQSWILLEQQKAQLWISTVV